MCCTKPWLGPGESALPIDIQDPIASAETEYTTGSADPQPDSLPNLLGASVQPVQNLAMVPNDGYFGQSQGITSPDVASNFNENSNYADNLWSIFSTS